MAKKKGVRPKKGSGQNRVVPIIDPSKETTDEKIARLEQENAQLRKENASLQMDRAILKKATARSSGQRNASSNLSAGVENPNDFLGR